MKSNYFKHIVIHSIIWSIAFSFYSLMRHFGHELVEGPAPQSLSTLMLKHLTLGTLAGLTFATTDLFLLKKLSKRLSFGKVIIVSSFVYLISFIIIATIGVFVFTFYAQETISIPIILGFLTSKEFILILFYCSLIVFLIQFIKQIDQKFGPGNLWKMIIGKFYNPIEVERIIMFLDLKSSTAIAEKLGHLKYSKLIQDCFEDLSVIEQYHAEIYQYVGDEVVLTWENPIGLGDYNFLNAFFSLKNRLQERSDYYKQNYKLIPEFKGGCNVGKIVMAEVGIIKREIAYHGDTINTASRIQEECKKQDKEFLISEELYQLLNKDNIFTYEYIDDVLLKGKSKNVKIYSVSRSDITST